MRYVYYVTKIIIRINRQRIIFKTINILLVELFIFQIKFQCSIYKSILRISNLREMNSPISRLILHSSGRKRDYVDMDENSFLPHYHSSPKCSLLPCSGVVWCERYPRCVSFSSAAHNTFLFPFCSFFSVYPCPPTLSPSLSLSWQYLRAFFAV